MCNELTFGQFVFLAHSIRDKEKVDWNTGEGIWWRRCMPEAMDWTDLDLVWEECE